MITGRSSNKMETLKIGVIGTGHMGRNHVRNIAQESSRFDFVGIYDQNKEQAEKIAEQYSVKAFDDMDQLLDEVDAVVVAVPSSLHREVGLRVAEHNVNALIEKPLATTSKDAEEINEAFRSRGLRLAVGHIERFNSVITELKKILDPQEPFYLEIHRFSPFSGSGRITDTSVVEDLMIHDIDLACYLLDGREIDTVNGFGEVIRSGNIDFATSALRINGKTHAVICASRVAQEKERTLIVHTPESCIKADLLARTLVISRNTDMSIEGQSEDTYTQDGVVQRIFVPIKEPLNKELVAFYDSVVNDAPVVAGGEVGIRAIRICEEVLKDINKNK